MIPNRLIGANGYEPVVAAIFNVANAAGSGAGNPVTITVSNLVDQYGNGMLPASGAYCVIASPSQACMASITTKTTSGFTLTLTPPSGVTLAAGTFDVLVHG
jgi:hypothetical protein